MQLTYKTYHGKCDSCGTRFKYRATYSSGHVQRVEREYKGFCVEVTTGMRAWNSHNVCPECIVDVLQNNNARAGIVSYYDQATTTTVYLHSYEHIKRILTQELEE